MTAETAHGLTVEEIPKQQTVEERVAKYLASDMATATLTVDREDGVFRHLEFVAPKAMARLILITWPYNLLVAGSHGSFHFERYGDDTLDMFDWLRGAGVDPRRWASKLVNGADSVREYDRDRLLQRVEEEVSEAIRDDWAPPGLREAVREEILDSDWLDSRDIALQLVSDFQHGMTYRSECSCGVGEDHDNYGSAVLWGMLAHQVNEDHKVKVRETSGFRFSDVSEWHVHKPGYHFVYQCHAAVWAIGRYDAELAASKAVA